MPLYSYRCSLCDRVKTTYRSMENRRITPDCPDCDYTMFRTYEPVDFTMPKMRFERQVERNRKRVEKLGPGSGPVEKEEANE